MSFFPNVKIELWNLYESEELDDYGNKKQKYVVSSIVAADMQTLNETNQMETFGKILQDTYNIYLDKNVEVKDTTIFRVSGETSTFEVVGTPEINNHLIGVSHVKVVVEKQRKPTKLEE